MDVYNKDVANNSLYSLVQNEVIDEVKAILSGGTISPTFIDVIINDELIFNNSGFTMRIKPTTLTGNRSLTIPNVSGNIVIDGADQDLTNKSYKAKPGSVSTPSYSFGLWTNTGMWNDGLNARLHFGVNGSELLRLNQNEVLIYQAVEEIDGSVAVPSYSFASNRDSGFYYESKDLRVSCAIDGVRKLAIGSSNTIHGNINFFPSGSSSAPSIAFVSIPPASTTGLFYRATSILGFSAGGAEIMNMSSAGLTILDSYKLIAGGSSSSSESNPAITFNEAQTHGIYTTTGNELSFTVNSTRRMFLSSSQQRNTVPIRCNDGALATPAYSFASATNTGIFRDSTGYLGFCVSGTERFNITSTAINVAYSGGGTSLAFTRSDGGLSAGTLRIDSSNNFRLTASSGGASILLDPSTSGFVRTDRYYASDLAYTGLTGTFRDLEVRNDGVFAYNSSSSRYKGDIKNYDKSLDELMKIEPKCYKITKNKNVVFEEVRGHKIAKITLEEIPKEQLGPECIGLLAEDLHEAGLNEYVDYDEDGLPDGVRYKELVLLCINSIKELTKKIG
jgi:hypothetical protein